MRTAAATSGQRPDSTGCFGPRRSPSSASATSQIATLSIQSAASLPAGLVIGLAPSFRNPSPTCEINVAAPIGIGAFSTDPSGRTDLPLVIPNDPALQGATFLLQSAIVTPGGALFGTVELTEGLLVVVGG